jgi:Protein of unknown function (DUF1236)
MISIRRVTPLVVLFLSTGVAFAQTPLLDSGVAPHVDLTAVQKQTVYQSISKTQKNSAAPTGFRATVGALVPEGVSLAPVPATVAELMPQTKGLESAIVEGQVVLVEPQGKKVVAVIVPEP